MYKYLLYFQLARLSLVLFLLLQFFTRKMMKRSAFRDKDISLLYEYARNDLFLHPMATNRPHQKLITADRQGTSNPQTHQMDKGIIKAPSITAIFLLELEVKLIQMISGLPAKPPKHVVFASVIGTMQQMVRWTFLLGLVLLDYVSRVLGVDNEMARLSQENSSDPTISPPSDQLQQHHHCYQHHNYEQPLVDLQVVHLESSVVCIDEQQNIGNSYTKEEVEVEVVEEHDKGTHRCTGCSPSKLPIRARKTSVPSRTGSSPMGHVRSLSNNMTLPAKHAASLGHNHSLRRIDGQRNLVSVNPSIASSSSSLSQHSADHHCLHHHHHHRQPLLAEPPRRSTSTHL